MYEAISIDCLMNFSIKFPSKNDAEKFCGLARSRDPNEEIKTDGTGNPVIKFISDDSVQHTGFLFRYKSNKTYHEPRFFYSYYNYC